ETMAIDQDQLDHQLHGPARPDSLVFESNRKSRPKNSCFGPPGVKHLSRTRAPSAVSAGGLAAPTGRQKPLVFVKRHCEIFPKVLERMTMKFRLLTPGPTPVPEEPLLELAKPMIYHRTAEFRRTLSDVLDRLKTVFATKNTIIPLTSSGSGALEAA